MSKRKPAAASDAKASAARRKAALVAKSGIESGIENGRGAGRPLVSASKNRKGKRSIAIYMDQIVKDELDSIALRERRSIQDLGLEAINLLLARYGGKAIA